MAEMTLDEVEQWCECATKALLLEGGLEAAPAVFWEFAALDVGPVTYQHLLFEFSRMHDESDWSLSFTRQAWFDDEDEPEIFGFSWRIVPPRGDTEQLEISRFGAREGETCGWQGDWLPWDAFRAEVERDLRALRQAGYELTADLLPPYTPSVPVAVDPERERERSLVIDVDDPATWTRHIREWAGLWIPELDNSSAVMADLELPGGAEDELRSILHNFVFAFHCTRLLPYEVEAVRERGLRVLSPRRMEQRILDARGNGFLTDSQVASLLPQIAPPAEEGGREVMLAFLLGRAGLDEPEASGALAALSRWGSEGLNAQAEDPLGALSIGVPAIILTQVILHGGAHVRPTIEKAWLAQLFIGTLLNSWHRYREVQVRLAVDPNEAVNEWQAGHPKGPEPEVVIDIWQPGHPEYDRHKSLPR